MPKSRKTSRKRKIKSRQLRKTSRRRKSILRMDTKEIKVPYRSPSSNIIFYRQTDENDKEQRLLEHSRRLEGEFIFDFDNFCHNIGLIDNLALYDEINFFVATKQLRPKAMNNTIFGSNGIFKDNRLIPTLIEEKSSQSENASSEKVYAYGRHKIRIKFPDSKYPNRILGEGSYGMVLQASFDNEEIVVKILHQTNSNGKRISADKLLRNIVRETTIQSHLSCSYSRYLLEQPDMAIIPSVKMIGKTLNGEYYIGMEKLTKNLEDYLISNKKHPDKILNAINSVCKLIGYLQTTEKFLHRDLHTGNVMYNASNGRFYIIDFGMSCLLNRDVINNDTLYNRIPHTDDRYYYPYYNKSHDLRLFLGSVLDDMGYNLPRDIGRMIAKRFAYFAFNKYESDYFDSESEYSDSDYSGSRSDSGSDETIFSNLYDKAYKNYDYRFDPSMIKDENNNYNIMREFVLEGALSTPTPEQVARYEARNKLQRLVKYYYV